MLNAYIDSDPLRGHFGQVMARLVMYGISTGLTDTRLLYVKF